MNSKMLLKTHENYHKHLFFFLLLIMTNGSSELESDLAEEIVVSDVHSTGTFCISSPVSDTTMAE